MNNRYLVTGKSAVFHRIGKGVLFLAIMIGSGKATLLYARHMEDTQIGPFRVNAFTTHSSLFGIGSTNLYDTYLSPLEYKGGQISFLRESLRCTHWLEGRITTQSLLHGYFGYARNRQETAREMAGQVGYDIGWHYNWILPCRLRLMAGGLAGGQLGFLYNMRGGNNPAQARISLSLSASVAAIYPFRIRRVPLTARYQLDAPVLGATFSPAYGQSYYEIFYENDYDHNICCTHPGNAPSFRHLVTLDFPIKGFTFRVGYLCDIRQYKVNNLRNHTYNHSLMIGYVKHFHFIKKKDRLNKRFIL